MEQKEQSFKFAGLTDAQVEESRRENGSNGLTEVKGEGFWKKLLANFGDPMIKILCVALLVNIALVIYQYVTKDPEASWLEPVGIAVAVLIATLVSTFSEYRNENAFQKLQEEASKILIKVYRNGTLSEISVDEIVVGDYVVLQSGDKIPADGIIVDGEIKVDQSVLNGESKEATKIPMPTSYVDDGVIDLLNEYKVYRGAVVCSGNATMKVTVVGDKSEYGKIAKELQIDDGRESPLKIKLTKLANKISKFGYIGGIAIAVAFICLKFFIEPSINGTSIATYFSDWKQPVMDALDAVMLAVIIIVMAVPEGLPLMIAIVSAQNMGKMLKDNVLVRKVEGIETAGSINLLFSDKTGTITKGNLEAVTFVDGQGNETKEFAEISEILNRYLTDNITKNTVAIMTEKDGKMIPMGGNATERALLSYVSGNTQNASELKVIKSIPFNSTDKFSATQVENADGKQYTLIKGAPEKIITRCDSCFDENGNIVKTDFKELNTKIDELAARMIRVLAFAVSNTEIDETGLPDGGLTLIGVVGLRDEIRPESVTAIKEVSEAGIQVIMITGDRKETAVAIAKEAGLLKADDEVVLTSNELQSMTDDEIKEVLPKIRVIARALPGDKSRLVRLSQELNLVVGMTGDGVNDSPALKKADVGFAMGSGTEVAKEAGDIVILNDNFNSIAKAILYGRTIFNTVRKFIVFQLTINVAAVLISFFAPLFGGGSPLSVTQILWINLIIDTFAALAFGGEPPLKRYMKEKPKRRDEDIVSKYMWISIGVGALYTFAVSMIFIFVPAFKSIFADNTIFGVTGSSFLTGYFTLFVFIAVFNAFNARTDKYNLFDNIKKNHGFWQILCVIVAIQILLVYVGSEIFYCYGLNIAQWGIVIGLAIMIIPVDLLKKFIINKVRSKKLEN